MLPALFTAIQEASAGRPSDVLTTPLERSDGLSRLYGCNVLLKCEHLQTTGSFKYRGSSNKLRVLKGETQRLGVVTGSSGNHGQALARAGRKAGVPVTVYVAATASPAKLASIRGYGADLRLVDGPPLDAEIAARRDAETSGRIFVSPYNDLDVIAGQGTIALELLEQTDELDAVFVSVGGGGLAAGIGAGLRGAGSRAKLIGCWPEVAPTLMRSLEAGKILDIEEQETISDGTAGGVEADAVTFPLCAELLDQRVGVSEEAIARAMWEVARHERWIVEGAAGVALAGVEALREQMRGKTVAVIVCGRNIDTRKYLRAVAPYGVASAE
jgi:threonine dehydratase